MKKFYLIVIPLLCSCSALTLHQGTESLRMTRDTEEKKETKIIETGSPPLVSRSTNISVDSDGPVTINPGKDDGKTGPHILNAELLKALAEIKNHRNTDQISSFKESVEIDFYKKMSYLGGLFFVLVAIACLMMVRALKQLRLETTKWGFDPKTVGKSAHKLMKMVEGVDDLIGRESSSLTNKLTTNGISDETASQINRSMLKLNEMKKIVDRVENIQRTHYGA